MSIQTTQLLTRPAQHKGKQQQQHQQRNNYAIMGHLLPRESQSEVEINDQSGSSSLLILFCSLNSL